MERKRFHVGDHVRFYFGTRPAIGLVVEDRGTIGVGGRRLYRVHWPLNAEEPPMPIEIPADELELVTPKKDSSERA